MKVSINKDFIKLGQLLKLASIADSGATAKMLILDGKVKVNNKICYERGKKIYDGFTILVLGQSFEVIKE